MKNRPFKYLVCAVIPEYGVIYTPYSSFKQAKLDLEESRSDGAEMVAIYKYIYFDSE